MPSIAAAQKHVTTDVLELAQSHEEKNKILKKAILFGNRTLIASLIKNFWVRLSATGLPYIKPKNILSLGEKTNRLLLGSGFSPSLRDGHFVSALIFPSSQDERESAEVYFLTPWFNHSLEVAESLWNVLKKEHRSIKVFLSGDSICGCRSLDNIPWRLENLKRVLGANSERYAIHVGVMLTLVAVDGDVEMGVVQHLPEINLLLDEVARLKKESNKNTLAAFARSLSNCRLGVKFSKIGQVLEKDSIGACVRLIAIMLDCGLEVRFGNNPVV